MIKINGIVFHEISIKYEIIDFENIVIILNDMITMQIVSHITSYDTKAFRRKYHIFIRAIGGHFADFQK